MNEILMVLAIATAIASTADATMGLDIYEYSIGGARYGSSGSLAGLVYHRI